MADIIEKGYAIQVPNDELDRDDGKVWYIPHHGVYHPKKPEKIRVVFDCSAKFQGVSLNNLLLQGPDLTDNLLGVLLRFRQEPIALMADIEAMFHQRYGWDAKIKEDDRKKWLRWLSDLPKLENVSTQRCYKPADFGEVKVREIHHFSDASEYGYGVASYIRLINENGRIHCAFLMGKARVAPLKKITIPRLELTAATVAVRMNRMLEEELDIKNDKVYFWTDSTSVIKYCANETSRFHTFVANRINIIREGSDSKQWKYVDTKSNPADDASRGLTVDKFLQNKRWLRGPDFLWKRESEWPTQQDISRALCNKDPEVKREASVYSTVLVEQEFGVEKILLRYSSMMKLKKIVGWFLLAKKNLQDKCRKRKEGDEDTNADTSQKSCETTIPPVSLENLQRAEDAIMKYVQRKHFPDEMALLQRKKQVRRYSPLYKLDPILDKGIIRVGGRLERASVSPDSKHPIVLPKDSPVSTIILQETHKEVGHLGRNSMLAKLREKYWILQAPTAIRNLVTKCVICRKYRAKVCEQKMSDLPKDRITPEEPPFTRTGVDYFGPLEVKRGRVTDKRYGAIFTCMATRAVHLEVACS
ncbi:uncharacterized protein [Ptychodera flava]|uniref:uncharacterized protein n=1 Tax=Ptychodera flava TaxID=63121 RepID=UPI00396A96F9